MATLIKDQARLDAAALIDRTWTMGAPIDPERIAFQLDIIVTRLPLENGISGMLKAEPDFTEIFVNSADTPARQRFTIAHELGHYIERTSRGSFDFNFIDYRDNRNYDLHEFYADEFAGALLMPAREIRALVDAGEPLPIIAAHFGVSVPAAAQRVKRLDQ